MIPLKTENAFMLPQRQATQNQIQLLHKVVCPRSLKKQFFLVPCVHYLPCLAKTGQITTLIILCSGYLYLNHKPLQT